MGVFHRPTALPRWPALFLHALFKPFPRNPPLSRNHPFSDRLLEQQFDEFRRRLEGKEYKPSNKCLEAFVKALLVIPIDVKVFSYYARIEQLMLCANTIKHGRGSSESKLRELRRDLFLGS